MSDIMDLVKSSNFTKLVEVVTAAGLVDTLKGPGPFTVFAPTDEAFDGLPSGAMKVWLNDIPKLKDILLYHVVLGKIMSEELNKQKSVKSILGQELKIEPAKGLLHKNIRVNGNNITKMDMVASNGVCHAIDYILIPK